MRSRFIFYVVSQRMSMSYRIVYRRLPQEANLPLQPPVVSAQTLLLLVRFLVRGRISNRYKLKLENCITPVLSYTYKILIDTLFGVGECADLAFPTY